MHKLNSIIRTQTNPNWGTFCKININSLHSSKDTWQLNATSDQRLDPGLGFIFVFLKRIFEERKLKKEIWQKLNKVCRLIMTTVLRLISWFWSSHCSYVRECPCLGEIYAELCRGKKNIMSAIYSEMFQIRSSNMCLYMCENKWMIKEMS